jgi:CRP-like cAMP-binding protein
MRRWCRYIAGMYFRGQSDATDMVQVRDTDLALGMPDPVVKALSLAAVPREIMAGDVLFGEGEAPEGFYLLLSGQVGYAVSCHNGGPMAVGWVDKGHAIGLSAVVAGEPHAMTAIARSRGSALFFSARELGKLLEHYPSLWLKVALLLSAGMQQAYSQQIALHTSRTSINLC